MAHSKIIVGDNGNADYPVEMSNDVAPGFPSK